MEDDKAEDAGAKGGARTVLQELLSNSAGESLVGVKIREQSKNQ